MKKLELYILQLGDCKEMGYVTSCDMLVGRAEETIQQRKKKCIAAQQRRKEINRRIAEWSRLEFRNPLFP